MKPTPPLQIVSAVQAHSAELIDGGDTLAVRMRTADGGEAALLIPAAAAIELVRMAASELARPYARRRKQENDTWLVR